MIGNPSESLKGQEEIIDEGEKLFFFGHIFLSWCYATAR